MVCGQNFDRRSFVPSTILSPTWQTAASPISIQRFSDPSHFVVTASVARALASVTVEPPSCFTAFSGICTLSIALDMHNVAFTACRLQQLQWDYIFSNQKEAEPDREIMLLPLQPRHRFHAITSVLCPSSIQLLKPSGSAPTWKEVERATLECDQ